MFTKLAEIILFKIQKGIIDPKNEVYILTNNRILGLEQEVSIKNILHHYLMILNKKKKKKIKKLIHNLMENTFN